MKSVFSEALACWPSASFNEMLKSALIRLPVKKLPLNQITNLTGFIDDKSISFSILSSFEEKTCLQVRIGIFFKELLAGCNCSDDPEPIDSYAEMLLIIDIKTADYEFHKIV